MKPVTQPRIKICCIKSIGEAWTAIEAGAAALGLVSAMPSGLGIVDNLDTQKLRAFFAAVTA